jgi:large subunit ribosomal protein L29
MTFVSFNDLKDLNGETLSNQIIETKKTLFDLRLKKATRQSFKPHLFKHNKRKIAQLLTLESQKKQIIK